MNVLHDTRSFENMAYVPCAICGSANVDQGGFCFRCLAPLELSRSVAARGTPSRFLSVLGASNAGKTVYLGVLLDILSKGSRGLRGLPNGSFSVSVQQETITALQLQRFPEKTPSEADHWRWVHCEVAHGKKQKDYLDIITPDLAGEAIAAEIEQPGTLDTIRVVVLKSGALMILIDSLCARDAGRGEDLFALKLLSYVCSLHGSPSPPRRGKLTLPVAFVFTKTDLCPEAMENPSVFASANMPGLLRLCERNLASYGFFATSVVGASATVMDDRGHHLRIPLHIEPRGVVEPLLWVLEHL